jgi:TonB-linked SusC/RagA family outer membrane protein
MHLNALCNLRLLKRRLPTKTLLIMKLIILLTVVACLHASAGGYAQKLTISKQDVSLEVVFKEIKKQTGYNFLYNYDWLQNTKKVTVEVKEASINQVLDICFKDQPLSYEIIDKTITLKQKTISREITVKPFNVQGRVVNETEEPIVGVTITVKGSNQATSTDASGEFYLLLPDKNAVLIFSGANVESFTYNVEGKSNLWVKLTTKINKLDEVQVIAYGTTTQRLSTGNVSTIKATDIEKQPVNNPLLALEGRVPGLNIIQATGLPGSGIVMEIQGLNSISNGNDPFYVVDGVPYPSQLLPNLGNVLGNSGRSSIQVSHKGNSFAYINPSDIESITVLKDADATAVYGSRAANGAILITTKKGKLGRVNVDVDLQNGFGKVARKLDLLNTKQYLEMRREAFKNDGVVPNINNAQDLLLWDTTRYTDWQKTLLGGTAQYNNFNVSTSGGTKGIQYFIGGTYHKETSVFPGNFSDKKGALHFNINSVSENQKFKVQLSGNYLSDNNQLPQTDLTNIALNLAPNSPTLYNSDGSLNWGPNAVGNSTWMNPLSYLYQKYANKANNLVSNALLSYNVLRGLEIKTSLGYSNLQTNEIATTPLASIAPENRPYNSSFSFFNFNRINTWLVEPQLTYKRIFGQSKFEALLGTTFQQTNNDGNQLVGIGYNNDLNLQSIYSASSVRVNFTTASLYKYNAFFGRLNYDWKDKYLINVTVRRDGSSRFGLANQFHNFEAAGIGWIFSNEPWLRKTLPIFSFGKVKASYGITGNDQIGDYTSLNLYTPIVVDVPYQGAASLLPIGLENPYLQWEVTKKLEFGLDLGIIKDRILVNFNYYQNRSSNELLPYSLPILTGFNSITKNFPALIQNSGIEISVNTINFKNKHFTWNSSFNLTIPRNKLISFPNLALSSYANTLVVGQSIKIIKAFHSLGVDPSTGAYIFESKSNPSNPNPLLDKTVNIIPDRKFYGGIENAIDYKGFELDILFQFVKQLGPNYTFGHLPGRNGLNQPVSVLTRWRNPGDQKDIQRFSENNSLITKSNNISQSDRGYSDASFIRLRNLSLSWQLPAKWQNSLHLHNCKVILLGQNILTLTHYNRIDPENESISSIPPLKTWTGGIHLTL